MNTENFRVEALMKINTQPLPTPTPTPLGKKKD